MKKSYQIRQYEFFEPTPMKFNNIDDSDQSKKEDTSDEYSSNVSSS